MNTLGVQKGVQVYNKRNRLVYQPACKIHHYLIRETEIEQNRCAMACQGCGAVSSTSSKIGSDRIVPR